MGTLDAPCHYQTVAKQGAADGGMSLPADSVIADTSSLGSLRFHIVHKMISKNTFRLSAHRAPALPSRGSKYCGLPLLSQGQYIPMRLYNKEILNRDNSYGKYEHKDSLFVVRVNLVIWTKGTGYLLLDNISSIRKTVICIK